MAPRIGFMVASCLTCLSSFWFMLAFSDSDVNLQPLFYFTEEPGGVVYGRRNSSICVNCSAFCVENGRVNITWRKDDVNITNTLRRYVLRNGTLCIEQLRRQVDEGIYECLATHRIGTIVSPKVKLELIRISSLSVAPINVSAVEGESVRFQCLVNGTLSSGIEWLHNGQSIATDSHTYRVTVLKYLGVLQIVNVTVKDGGQYRCVVANRTSSTATLRVTPATVGHQVAVVLLGRPMDQDVVLFQTLVLECFLNGLPAPTVIWSKQGGVLGQSVQLFGSGNLEIVEMDESDAGIYTCSWMQSSAQANVTVSVPPQLLPLNSMLPFTLWRREQIIRLNCHFYGQPFPRITWFKNGQRLQQNNRIKIDEFNELSIPQIKLSDAGMYQCRAENRVGMNQATTQLKFESNAYSPWPPVGLAASVNRTSIQLSWMDPPRNRARNVSAYCVHISQPNDDQWVQHVVQRISPSGGSKDMSNLQPYTNYTMYVVAYNMYGGSEHSRTLTVTTGEDVPISFPLLQLVPLDMNSVRLNWKELTTEQARGIITEFRILYRKHGTQTYQQVALRPFRTEYVLEDLEPNTKYDITVAARTSAGYPSLVASSVPWVSCLTKAYNQSDVPDAPEMNAFAVEDVAIFVNWTVRNQSVPTLGYKLFCQISSLMENEEPTDPVILHPNVSSHLFSNLEPSMVYQLRLLAFNQKGESQASALTVQTTSPASNGVPPNHLPLPSSFPVEAESINGSTISLRWKKPATLPSVAEYTVRYRRISPPLVKANGNINRYLQSLTESLIVGDLDPFTTYEFTVETRGNPAVRSQAVKCQTNEAVPSAPLDLDVTVVNSGGVHLQWNPPANKNGVITKYRILYTQIPDWPLAHWFTKVENGTLLSTMVMGLRSGVVYYFQVQAATSVGYGSLSDIAHISLGPAAAVGGLSDQDLGIVIGTAIGVTCIIICTCIIVLRNRCCPVAPVAMASAGTLVANGTVSSCRCHSVNCTAEFHILHPSAEINECDDGGHLQLASVGLVENRHCDTKGGNVPNGRNPRFLGQKCTSQSPVGSLKEPPENQSQAVPLLDTDGGPHRSSEDVLDLEGIDYEEDSEAEKVTLVHEGTRQASYSRQDKAPANHDRLLGGNLPSRKTNHLPEGDISSDGKEEEGEGPEENDYSDTQSDSYMQKGNDCDQERHAEGQYGGRCYGLITNCKCQDERQDFSHRNCDNSQQISDSIGDCNDPDSHRHGDRNDDVMHKELCSEHHDNHKSLGHVAGCITHCPSKNNNLTPRDISLAAESMTNWGSVETSCNQGNDEPPLISNQALIGTDYHGNLSTTLPLNMVDNFSSDLPIAVID